MRIRFVDDEDSPFVEMKRSMESGIDKLDFLAIDKTHHRWDESIRTFDNNIGETLSIFQTS